MLASGVKPCYGDSSSPGKTAAYSCFRVFPTFQPETASNLQTNHIGKKAVQFLGKYVMNARFIFGGLGISVAGLALSRFVHVLKGTSRSLRMSDRYSERALLMAPTALGFGLAPAACASADDNRRVQTITLREACQQNSDDLQKLQQMRESYATADAARWSDYKD
jgi:hypothetical protein